MISFVWSIYKQTFHGKSITFLLTVKQKEKYHARVSRSDLMKNGLLNFVNVLMTIIMLSIHWYRSRCGAIVMYAWTATDIKPIHCLFKIGIPKILTWLKKINSIEYSYLNKLCSQIIIYSWLEERLCPFDIISLFITMFVKSS